MAHDHPECENCDFFIRNRHNLERRCRKHNFVMPLIDWQMICKDWSHAGNRIDFEHMEDNMLYYYSYGTGFHTAQLAYFKNLQRMVLSVRIRQDAQFGWVIFPGKHHSYFPPPETLLTILIENRRCKFQVVNHQRKLAIEMIPSDEGKWNELHHMQQSFMLYSLESPDLLYDWFNIYLDMDRYIEERFSPNMFAFIEVVDKGKGYVLHPDLLTYNSYMREQVR